jgi:hypothetical protein
MPQKIASAIAMHANKQHDTAPTIPTMSHCFASAGLCVSATRAASRVTNTCSGWRASVVVIVAVDNDVLGDVDVSSIVLLS